MADAAQAPGVVDDPTAFAEFVASLTDPVRGIVLAADALIRTTDPAVVQVLWAHQRTAGYGVGPKKLSEHYCYLDVYDEHVNLGFNRGVLLADPEGLLSGSGAKFRKTTLRSERDVAVPAIRALLVAAREERRAAL